MNADSVVGRGSRLLVVGGNEYIMNDWWGNKYRFRNGREFGGRNVCRFIGWEKRNEYRFNDWWGNKYRFNGSGGMNMDLPVEGWGISIDSVAGSRGE